METVYECCSCGIGEDGFDCMYEQKGDEEREKEREEDVDMTDVDMKMGFGRPC